MEEDSASITAPAAPHRFSPSSLNRYRSCPRSYLYADIERRPRDERATPRLVLANAIHHALERWYGLTPDERSLEMLHQALRFVWPKHRRPGAFNSRAEEADCGRSALDMLTHYFEGFDTSTVPLAREQWVTARLKGAG